ncbi:hypothetical protein M758_1G033000 [Ceratodon purpureus]|nr:hypothetical protein M758_1G033000 [Ceratodon purpureus]
MLLHQEAVGNHNGQHLPQHGISSDRDFDMPWTSRESRPTPIPKRKPSPSAIGRITSTNTSLDDPTSPLRTEIHSMDSLGNNPSLLLRGSRPANIAPRHEIVPDSKNPRHAHHQPRSEIQNLDAGPTLPKMSQMGPVDTKD